jgi:hypothetical protein
MHNSNPDINLLAFYEIARRAHLTDHPDLMKSPRFKEAGNYMRRGRLTCEKPLANKKPSMTL